MGEGLGGTLREEFWALLECRVEGVIASSSLPREITVLVTSSLGRASIFNTVADVEDDV